MSRPMCMFDSMECRSNLVLHSESMLFCCPVGQNPPHSYYSAKKQNIFHEKDHMGRKNITFLCWFKKCKVTFITKCFEKKIFKNCLQTLSSFLGYIFTKLSILFKNSFRCVIFCWPMQYSECYQPWTEQFLATTVRWL